MTKKEVWLTVPEYAKRVGKSKAQIYLDIRLGKIKQVKMVDKITKITRIKAPVEK